MADATCADNSLKVILMKMYVKMLELIYLNRTVSMGGREFPFKEKGQEFTPLLQTSFILKNIYGFLPKRLLVKSFFITLKLGF